MYSCSLVPRPLPGEGLGTRLIQLHGGLNWSECMPSYMNVNALFRIATFNASLYKIVIIDQRVYVTFRLAFGTSIDYTFQHLSIIA